MNSPATTPLVSVIVPTYQRQDYLIITLKSILAQSHRRLEVLVVSDGDDDETAAAVHSLDDSRAKYLFTDHAGFPAVPRNKGLRHAQGELLAFCDDDDVWYPTKLTQQIPVLADNRFGMCTTDYEFIDPDGELASLQTYYSRYHGEIDWRVFFHSMGFICNAAGVFTRAAYEAVGPLNEAPELKAHEDYEYWMRILMQFPGYFMDEKLVGYRVHPGSIQKTSPWGVLQRRRILHRILKQQLEIPLGDFARKSCKLWVHFFLDQFPVLKTATRVLQGKTQSQ